MCVLPDRQRSGVGHALLRYLTEELQREGTEKIYLISGPEAGPPLSIPPTATKRVAAEAS
jgi:GNAT superfamily N-acetyltransferase